MTVDQMLVAGRYRLSRSLGVGGMGRVWLARDEVLRRDVAVKEIALPFGLADDEREEMRLRTLREARAAARLSHPNVVQIYDVEPGDDRPWIVMEYVRSRSLLQVIKENGPLPVDQVAGIGLAVLSALDAATRVGVLHRDVKPSNVLIADDGRVVLTDFGSAMIDEGEGALTRTGVILGSPQYIAPERVHKGVSTPEADLWSLGATLYDAVEGRPPYTRETTLGTLVALATDKPDPTRLAGPLKPVITGLLQRNPQSRMKPAEVEERLRKIADVQTTVRLRQVPAPRRPVTLAEMSRYEPAALGAAAVGADLQDKAPVAAQPAAPAATSGQPPAAGQPPTSGQPPAAGQPPAPARPPVRRPGRPLLLRLATASAVVIVLIGLGVFAVTAEDMPWSSGRKQTPNRVQSGPGMTIPTLTPNAAPPAASPAAPTTRSNVLPAGYRWWNDRSGFRVPVPKGWTQPEGRQKMFFCAPGGPPLLKVHPWSGSPSDLQGSLEREEARVRLADYKRLRMEELPGQRGAVWEYTFRDPKMGPQRARDRVIVAGGRAYVIQWQVGPTKWQAHLTSLDVVTKGFQPPTGA